MSASVPPNDLRDLAEFSARVGRRSELVQGAGGNISQKGDRELWIKASGKWLADAESENIFVPVDLPNARSLIGAGVADLSPCVMGEGALRPSMETAMHALLEFPIVVHLHSIHALAWVVRKDGRDAVAARLRGIDWAWIDYARPGQELGRALRALLANHNRSRVILLGNHGLLLGGESIAEVESLIEEIEVRLEVSPRTFEAPSDADLQRFARLADCRLPAAADTHALARDPLSLRLGSQGALYPDHAVFLGRSLPVLPHDATDNNIERCLATAPYCVIVEGHLVLLGRRCTAVAEAMLTCCAQVVLRQASEDSVSYLSADEADALCDWEVEAFRKQQSDDRPRP